MLLRATLLAALGLFTLPASAQSDHNTGTVTFGVFGDGLLGADQGVGTGFTFTGTQGLYEAALMVGDSEDRVSGQAYSGAANTPPNDWVQITAPTALTPPFAAPYDVFDQAFEATFDDSASPNPLGITVRQRTYSSMTAPNEDFVLVVYDIENTTATDYTDVHVGLFADWDVNAAVANFSEFDAATQSLRVFDTAAATKYYGMSVVGNALSGYEQEIGAGSNPVDGQVYFGMSTFGTTVAAPDDIRSLVGQGEYDLPAGATITAQFAMIGGEDEADFLANAQTVLDLFPNEVSTAAFSTSTITGSALNNGNIGGDCDANGDAFVFNGEDALCGAGFLVGFSEDNVVGDAYILDETTEWSPAGPIVGSSDFPFMGFTDGVKLSYVNTENMLSVEHNVYTGETYPDVALHVFDVTNSGTSPISGAYIGTFSDFDVAGAAFASNAAFRDGSTIYVTDPTGASTNVFGVSMLGVDLSGWDYFINYPSAAGEQQSEGEMYVGLTTPSADGDEAIIQDQRSVQGAGPYDIAAGETVRVLIAFAAGESVSDLLMNIGDVAGAVGVADEAGPSASLERLAAPAPNPTSNVSRVTVSLDANETVRVTVMDVLGRQVATLHDGPLVAGETSLTLDASSLAPGVYVVRAEGESFRQARSLTVVR